MELLINLVSNIEHEHFDIDKIEADYGYLPFYNYILSTLKQYQPNMIVNYGISHFEYYTFATKEQILRLLMLQYKKYLK